MLIKQLKRQIFTTLAVIISVYLSFKFPLAKNVLSISDSKVLSTIDLAIYNCIFSIPMGLLWQALKRQFLHVKIKLESGQKTNHIYLTSDDVSEDNPTEVLVRATFTITGSRRIKYPTNVATLTFPSSYSAQTQKGYSYVKESTETNSFLVDLSKMVNDSYPKITKLDMVKTIDFSVTLDEFDKNNKDTIRFKIGKKFAVMISNEPLILEQQ